MAPTCEHPGAELRRELDRRGLTVTMLARAIGTGRDQVAHIVRGRRAITPPMALRIAKALRMDARDWLRRQGAYDLERAARQSAEALSRIRPLVG